MDKRKLIRLNELLVDARQSIAEASPGGQLSFVAQLTNVKDKIERQQAGRLSKDEEAAVSKLIGAFGQGFRANMLRRIKEAKAKARDIEPELEEAKAREEAAKAEYRAARKHLDKFKRRVGGDKNDAEKEKVQVEADLKAKEWALAQVPVAALESEIKFRKRRVKAISASSFIELGRDMPEDTGLSREETEVAMDLMSQYIWQREITEPGKSAEDPDTKKTIRTISHKALMAFMTKHRLVPAVSRIAKLDPVREIRGATAGLSPSEVAAVEQGIRPEEDVQSRIESSMQRVAEFVFGYGPANPEFMPTGSEVAAKMQPFRGIAPYYWSQDEDARIMALKAKWKANQGKSEQ